MTQSDRMYIQDFCRRNRRLYNDRGPEFVFDDPWSRESRFLTVIFMSPFISSNNPLGMRCIMQHIIGIVSFPLFTSSISALISFIEFMNLFSSCRDSDSVGSIIGVP